MNDYSTLLAYFDPKKYNHEELNRIIDKTINYIKQNYNSHTKDHKAGGLYVVLMLYKEWKKFNEIFIDDYLEEFYIEYLDGYQDYMNSLVIMTDHQDATLTYYYGYVTKKIKGV